MLGLKAFVLAHPYDVPNWLPDLLLLLVRASFQPAPIKTSVRWIMHPVLLCNPFSRSKVARARSPLQADVCFSCPYVLRTTVEKAALVI